MIRKICSLALAILLASAGFLANAQNFSGGLIPLDIRDVYSNATGIKNVSAPGLTMTVNLKSVVEPKFIEKSSVDTEFADKMHEILEPDYWNKK